MFIEEEVREDSNIAVVSVAGDFFGGGEWDLYENVKSLVERGITSVVIDLTKTIRINSQGIGVLVSSLTSLRNAGGDMKIAGANKNIAAHLGMLNLYTVLEWFDNAEDAVASYQAAGAA